MKNGMATSTSSKAGTEKLLGLPVDKEILFSNHKGVYKKGVEKRQTKLFKKIDFIKPFLEEGETILLVTTGCSPTTLVEQLTTGWIFYIIKRSLFIFTDRRIFHVPTMSNFKYRNSIAEIKYSDCKNVTMKGSVLRADYLNGTTEKFLAIAPAERKRIRMLILQDKKFGDSKFSKPSKEMGKNYLCPDCTAKLKTDVFVCPKCRLEFKNKSTARKLSILLPGGGYFYTGRHLLGLGDAVAEIVLMLLVIMGIVSFAAGEAEGLVFLIFFGGALVFEKLITIYHADHYIKEFLPKNFKGRTA